MAITKFVTVTGFRHAKTGGVVSDLAAELHVQLVENGGNTTLTYDTTVSIWGNLTPAQKTGVQNIVATLEAMSLDPPLPRVV